MADIETLPRTPPQILGPFYPFMHKPIEDGDLTNGGKAAGMVLHLSGRIMTDDGSPIVNARVEIWQANTNGRYAHPNDTTSEPLDPAFHGFAVVHTDSQGRYAVKTIRPRAYQVTPGRWRPAHIHFQVDSTSERLVTQMYFAGDKYNETDAWRNSTARADALTVDPTPRPDGSQEATFDIVMMRA
jgi:protocatechuate 3,4-dioxygenase beta subunit